MRKRRGPKPTLLGIPAELRNEIYRLSLDIKIDENFDCEGMVISEHNAALPGLLSVCRQIREEASDIFFAENVFNVEVIDLKFGPQRYHWYWTIYPNADTGGWYFAGQVSWSNLKQWLKLYFEGKAPAAHYHSPDDICAEDFLKVKPFDLVDKLKKGGVCWTVVENALESMKEAFEGGHGDRDWDSRYYDA